MASVNNLLTKLKVKCNQGVWHCDWRWYVWTSANSSSLSDCPTWRTAFACTVQAMVATLVYSPAVGMGCEKVSYTPLRVTVETAKFGSHFCSDFSAELCSFRTWKILLSSDDMDELLSSDHMNELCNYELKSSDICSELLSCQNQWGNDEVKALMQGHTSSACYLTVQRMCSPDVNTLLSVSNSHCSVSAFIV